MDVLLFSKRLRRVLAGVPDEGTLPDGSTLQIHKLQNDIDSFNPFLRDLEFSGGGTSTGTDGGNIYIWDIKADIVDVISESESAIDTFLLNNVQTTSEHLCDALQGLETKFTHLRGDDGNRSRIPATNMVILFFWLELPLQIKASK